MQWFPLLQILLIVLAGFFPGGRVSAADAFTKSVTQIREASLAGLGEAVDSLARLEDARVIGLLEHLLEGRLYARKADDVLVYAEAVAEGMATVSVLDGTPQGIATKFELKKINLNNSLRSHLREIIGRLQLNADDPAQRLRAVRAMRQALDDGNIALLRARFPLETDRQVQDALRISLALADLDRAAKPLRIDAIATLAHELDPAIQSRLGALLEQDDSHHFLEADADIRHAAQAALSGIESKLAFNHALETVFFGLSLGAVLVLAAIGLAITFGVMGVINMAHGELMMLGAYTTYVVQQLMPEYLGLSLFVAIPAAFLISALVGMAIERGIIRFLYGRPLETLLATFGVSLFLQQLVRSIFSPLNRSVSTPEWMSGSWPINDALSLTLNRFYILLFCVLVFILLQQVLKRTRLGLEVRAVAQNRAMAKAMGIPTDRVDALTFGLGSGIAGIAGVALSQLTNVGPNLGQGYIVDSFMVVVFGGVGNLWGTLVAGFSLGVANKLLEPYSGAVLAKILVLVFIILFIQKRPRGLFPQKGRAAES
jgi:urea transport system permease protein